MPIFNHFQGQSITLERSSGRNNAVSSDSSVKKQKLVFLDRSLKDVMMLVNGVQANVEAILLDPEQDGIKQITHILTQYPAVKSVHLVAHGSSSSLILGSTELNLDNIDDYAEQLKDWLKSTVNVPERFQRDSLKLASYNSTDNVAFAAVQKGTVFTEFGIPSQIDVSKLLGWSHVSAGQVGTDILDNIGKGSGSIGFMGALPSGDYTFWFQQTEEPSTYTVEFKVAQSNNGGSKPVVSFTATPTLLKESEETALTLLQFTGGNFPEPNENASGFYFTITEQTATITLKVLDDGEVEGIENLTFTLQTGEG